jgi:hypothetical protein
MPAAMQNNVDFRGKSAVIPKIYCTFAVWVAPHPKLSATHVATLNTGMAATPCLCGLYGGWGLMPFLYVGLYVGQRKTLANR